MSYEMDIQSSENENSATLSRATASSHFIIFNIILLLSEERASVA
jgi:hypothetical protein